MALDLKKSGLGQEVVGQVEHPQKNKICGVIEGFRGKVVQLEYFFFPRR